MVPSLPASLLSSSGHTELRLWLGDRAVCLALFRAGSNAVAHGSLSGLPVESIATKPPRSAAEPVKTGQGERELRLAMAAGAYLHISAYRDDSFVLTAQGYQPDDCAEGEQPHPVEAEFSLEELGGCVGLGHLMRQPWPLEDGALELGPFYVRPVQPIPTLLLCSPKSHAAPHILPPAIPFSPLPILDFPTC